MELIKINSNNRPYYSDDFIKGFECGAQRQLEADKKDRPKGKWVWVEHPTFERCKCSICGYYRQLKIPEPDNYCPNCGARMRPRLQGKHFDSIIIDESVMKGADDA